MEPGHFPVSLETWAARLEDKLDRYHEDTQLQIRELQSKPEPVKDGEFRVAALEVRVAAMALEVDACTKFRQEAAVTKRLLARGWALAGAVGGLVASLFPVISGALR